MDMNSILSKANCSEKELLGLGNKVKTAAKKNVAPDIFHSTFVVDEHASTNKLVGRVTAFDLNNTDKLSYNIVSGNKQGVFKIDNLGNISIADSSKLNFESKNTYSLNVRVSDGQKTDTAKIVINLAATNEAPEAKDDTTQVGQNGNVVIKVLANDKDPNKDTISVSSIGKPAHGNVVLNTDGTVTYKPDAGFSGKDSFTYTVTDGKLTDTATVFVTVQGKVESPNKAPKIDNATMSIDENSAQGTVVGRVVASDANRDTLSYKILKGNDDGIFSINSNGDILIAKNAKLDYEQKALHSLTIETSDGKLTATATVKINVLNVNEAPVLNDATLNVAENSAAGTVVGKLTATDPDGNPVTYKIVSGNEAGLFKIDNTGQVTVAQGANLDYETKANHTLVVETSDGKLVDTATVKINVSNVNEAPVLNDTTLNVAENSVAGTVVGKLTATDPDGNTLSYKIVSGNESGFFSVNNNGQITVAQGAHLDYETKNAYTLSVEASDGKLVDTANVKINVGDINETPTQNPDPTPTGTVYEIGKAGSPYQHLSDINWNSLQGGDVVKIYWKPEAYAERILLSAHGTDGNPIIIEGVKGPNGELPVLTADNATTDDQFANFGVWRQNLGGSFYIGTPTSVGNDSGQPGFITIRGLELTGAGQGKTFTDALGRVSQEQGQPAIYVKGATNITIEDSYMHNNGMGVFSNSNHDYEVVENLVLRGNTFEDNGVVGSYLNHHVYTEGINTLIDGNTFLEKIDGDLGSLLKMRDVGVTVTNNYFGNTLSHAIDLDDVQADALNNLGLQNSEAFHDDNLIAGNHFNSIGGTIFLGGDSQGKDTGSGEGSGLYRESVDVVSNVFEYSISLENSWRFGLFRAPSGDQTFNLQNNIIDIKIDDTNPYYKPIIGLMADSGTINLIGTNWISAETNQGTDRSSGVVNGWNSPDTHHVVEGHLLMGTEKDDVITGTTGNDILFGGLGNDILTGGAGADVFFLKTQSGHDKIMDFNKNEDHLDISTILSDAHPLDSLLSEYVMLTKNGADTIVSIDTNGGGDNFTAVATLVGVNNLSAGGQATEAELHALVSNGTLIA